MNNQDRTNHRCWREFVRLTGVPPPKIQCPGGYLSPWVPEKLAERPDLGDWALGRLSEEEDAYGTAARRLSGGDGSDL